MVQVRAALPGAEIVHNAMWFDGDTDPDVARELHAADVVEIERGVKDGGITAAPASRARRRCSASSTAGTPTARA